MSVGSGESGGGAAMPRFDASRPWSRRAAWQVNLRWWVPPAIGFAVVLGALLGFTFEAGPILLVAALILAYNVVFWAAFRRARATGVRDQRVERRYAIAQVALDYAAMFVLVYYTGGAVSPLILFFLFHVVFGAILFRPAIAWLFAAVATVGVWLLFLGDLTGRLACHSVSYDGSAVCLGEHPVNVAVTLAFFTVTVVVTAGVTAFIMAHLRDANARAYHAIEALMEERSRYMLQVAHNTRAPLGAVLSMLDLLEDGDLGELAPEPRRYVSRIGERLRALNNTLGDLLQLALARQVADRLPTEHVDMRALAARVEETFADEAVQKGVNLRVTSPDSLPTVPGDAAALWQVLVNLVSNAIKYTPEGGEVGVTLAARGDQRVRLEVSDTGIGIPAAEQPRLFDEFFRASNAKRSAVDGTGLGLALVKRTVDAHGGEVVVSSAEGEGTTVAVLLPATV